MTASRPSLRSRIVRSALLVTAAAVLARCAQPHDDAPPSPITTPAASSSASPAPAAPTVQPVTAADLGATWRPGCPVDPQQLRSVEVDYIGFDGLSHRGALVVNHKLVYQVVAIFEELHRLRYPIETIRDLNDYPNADDELSMEDNNTSAFNCRDIPGSGRPSQHSYGRAIDLNPLLNPEVDGGSIQPTTAAPYLDRNRTDPGLLHAGDSAVRVFTDRGWHWGGYWHSPVDYQHFGLT